MYLSIKMAIYFQFKFTIYSQNFRILYSIVNKCQMTVILGIELQKEESIFQKSPFLDHDHKYHIEIEQK